MNAHIVILAAGSSSRMGSPKQLIDWHGKPLLRHLAEQAIATQAPIAIILGANADAIRPSLHGLSAQIVVNEHWHEGMSSSIRLAAQHIEADALLLMVCDQPLVTTAHLHALLDAARNRSASIIASEYANALGVPALFDRSMFDELARLEGQQGAKAIIQRHRTAVQNIAFADGAMDLDTPDDVDRLRLRA
jgi:molybdenum cofactor cytidylyltransferase